MSNPKETEAAAVTDAGPFHNSDSIRTDFDAIRQVLPQRAGPGVEVFFFDRVSRQRLADYSFVLSYLVSADDKPFYSSIHVILPIGPLSDQRESFIDRLWATHSRRLADGMAVPERAELERIFHIVELQNFTAEALIDKIRSVPRGAAIVVGNAHLFRSATIGRIPETGGSLDNRWVPHLVSLLAQAVAAAHESSSFVVFDVAMHFPTEEALRRSILDIDGVGVVAIAETKTTEEFEAVNAAIAGFGDRIEAGDATAVLAKIDALRSVGELQKEILSVQVLARAGLYDVAVERMKKPLTNLMRDGQGELLLKLARIAHLAGEEDLACEILTKAAGNIETQEALEDAMILAFDLDLHQVYAHCIEVLHRRFPHSPTVNEQSFRERLFNGEYGDCLALIEAGRAGMDPEGAAFYRTLLGILNVDGEPQYLDILKVYEQTESYGIEAAALICSHDAERRKLPVEGLLLALMVDPCSHRAADAARIMQRHMKILFALGGSREPNVIVRFLDWYLAYLSRHPADHRARHRLTNVLSATVAGLSGMGVLLWLFNNSFRAQAVDPNWQTARTAATDAEVDSFIGGAMEWLKQTKDLVIGHTTLPKHLFAVSADSLYPRMMQLLEVAAIDLEDPHAWDTYSMICCIAMGVARASSNPVEEISVLRLTGSRLAVSGRQQQARDFAEVALMLGEKSDLHARFAWVAFADIYHRLTNTQEAMIAIMCGLAHDAPISNEQAWYEAEIVSRISRDMNQYELANRAISSGQENLKAAGLAESQQHRVLVLHLTLRVRELLRQPNEADLAALIGEIVTCCELAERANDDPTPPVMLLGQALRTALQNGYAISNDTFAYFTHISGAIPEPLKSFVQLISALEPSFEDFYRLVRRVEASRSARNASFDFNNLSIIADHVLGTKTVKEDPAQTLYCIEVSTDRGTDFVLEGAERKNALALPNSPDQMLDWVIRLSNRDVDVVAIGISDTRDLVCAVTNKGSAHPAVTEPHGVFSLEKFRKWKLKFPYGFKDDAVNVYAEMVQLELSAVPSRRLLFIMDAELQSLPLNILMMQNELLGRGHAVALAPSMSWLVEAQARTDIRTGYRRAWIPLEFGGDGTLGMVAERLRPCFEQYSIILDESGDVPDNLGRSEIAVVVAHGGVHDHERYFSIISDDGVAKFHADALASSLSESRLVVLFVCSAGRMDKDFVSNTTVGLTKQLLSRGCSTVIGSPWPLNASVPAHWLPAFLDSWLGKGAAVIDACFIANQAVLQGLGDIPSYWLAMSVFGDPLLTAVPAEFSAADAN